VSKKCEQIVMLDYCAQSPLLHKAVADHLSTRFSVYDHHVETPPYVRRVYGEDGRSFFILHKTEIVPENVDVRLYDSALEMNLNLMPENDGDWQTIAIIGAICDRDPSVAKYATKYGRLADGLDYTLRHYSTGLAIQLLEAGMFDVLEENATTVEKIKGWENLDYETSGDFVIFGRRGRRRLPVNWVNKILDYLLRKTGCKYGVGYQRYGKDLWSVVVKKNWLSGKPFEREFVDRINLLLRSAPRGLMGTLAQKNRDTLVTWVPGREDARALIDKIVELSEC
jgi:hypothetical protein